MAQVFDTKRRALGKGLESLLPAVRAVAEQPPIVDVSPGAALGWGRPLEVSLDRIDRNPLQTRTHFDPLKDGGAGEFAHTGVVQPIVVKAMPNGRYQLIAGERRWLASFDAGKATIPAIVREATDVQAMEMTIVENLQRADLNPIEQARAFYRLGEQFHLTQEQMAARTGKDRASVANYLRLLKLPRSVQDQMEENELTFGHGRALLGLEDEAAMLAAAAEIVRRKLSVRETETYVAGLLNPERPAREARVEPAVDPNVKAAEERLREALGLRVKIEDRHGRGRVIIEYGGLEDFDAILGALE